MKVLFITPYHNVIYIYLFLVCLERSKMKTKAPGRFTVSLSCSCGLTFGFRVICSKLFSIFTLAYYDHGYTSVVSSYDKC